MEATPEVRDTRERVKPRVKGFPAMSTARLLSPFARVVAAGVLLWTLFQLYVFLNNRPSFMQSALGWCESRRFKFGSFSFPCLGVDNTVDGISGKHGPSLLSRNLFDLGQARTDLVGVMVYNLLVLCPFMLQHVIMAKDSVQQFFNEHLYRSIYVIASCVALLFGLDWWRPMPHLLFSIPHFIACAVHTLGWIFLIGGAWDSGVFDFFGTHSLIEFKERFLHRYMRHPITTGFLMIFWSTPYYTVGRLLYATIMSLFVVGTVCCVKEPKLVERFGDRYRDYQSRVPAFIPKFVFPSASQPATAERRAKAE